MTTAPVPSITEDLLQELEQKAKAATPGRNFDRIVSAGGGLKYTCTGDDGSLVLRVDHKNDEFGFIGPNCEADEALFLACTPQAIIALIAHIRAQAAELERIKAVQIAQRNDEYAAQFELPAPAAAPGGFMLVTPEQLDRHTTTAWECPPQSLVVLVSSLKRLHKKNALATPAAPAQSLDERMAAAGMLTVTQLLSGVPLDAFIRHAKVIDLTTFAEWVEMRRKEFLAMQARFTLAGREDDELYEWVVAHAAVFGEVHVNLKAAMSAAQEPVAWRIRDPSMPELGTWLSDEPAHRDRISEPLYAAPPAAEQPNHSGDSTNMVHCACGDAYPSTSYGAGFIDGSGMCPNCDAAIPARDIPGPPAAEQPDSVKVPRELLDSAATWLEVHAPGGGCIEGSVASELRALLAGGAA